MKLMKAVVVAGVTILCAGTTFGEVVIREVPLTREKVAKLDGDVDRIGLFSDDYDEEVFVTEGPVIRRQVGRTKLGFPIEIIELKGRVSYADLDLSREADVTVFELRVETAAKRSCEELAYRHSFEFMDRWAIMRCTNEAVDRSVEQMQAAIAANRSIAANR